MNLRSQFAVKRPVKLLISAEVDAPISFGWWRPCILLPAGVSLNQLELILNHELAHLRRRDWLVNLLVQVIGAPFFFHPLFYLVRGRLAEVREHICDDWVIQVTGRRADYAQCLVDMLSERGHRTRLALALCHRRSALVGRVKAILDDNRTLSLYLSRKAALLIGGVAVILLSLVSVAQIIPLQTMSLPFAAGAEPPTVEVPQQPTEPPESQKYDNKVTWLREIATQLETKLAMQGKAESLMTGVLEEGLILRLQEVENRPIFEARQAKLTPEAKQVLDLIVEEIKRTFPTNEIRVEGHTDGQPTHNPKFPSNWELSAARARSVQKFLIERGIDEGRTSFAGYGHVRPIADENVRDAAIKNEAMRRNRRVEILIIHPTEIPQSPVMSQRTYDFLRGQLAKALEDLQRTEKALQEAKKSGLFEALRNEDIDLVNQIADTKATLIETRMKFRDKEEQIRQLRTGEGSPPAEVLKLKTQVETLEKQLVQERKMFSDSWPSVVKLQKELVSARQQLVQAEEQAARTSKAQVASKLKQLENELTQLKLEETTLTRQLTRYEQTLTQFPPNVSSLSHLISQKKHAEMVYSFLLQRLNEARILAEIEKADDLIYNFDSIAVNTNDVDAARILIIKIHAVFEKEGVKTQLENLESLRVQLRNKLIAILSSRTAADLLKPQVKDELKESLRGEMNQLLGRGSVAAVYFSEYLIQ